MKTYVFMTYSIRVAGGVQCYLAGKASYLESKGWNVIIFSADYPNKKQKCLIPYLDKFLKYCNLYIGNAPHLFPKSITNNGVQIMRRMVEKTGVTDDDTVIVESHDDTYALWGELLAEKLKGRHIFFTMNEVFSGPGFCYQDKIDFFKFKLQRKEMWAPYTALCRLFDGTIQISKDDELLALLNEAPYQDVRNKSVDNLERCDYNICHIGRCEKNYVSYAFHGVGEFAGAHPDKSVQLVIVGNAEARRALLDEEKTKHPNLKITELGYLHPLPKDLIKKVDVVLACSGSARHSLEEGALVIVADAESDQSNGILGYETNSSIYEDVDSVRSSFSDALERALVLRVQEKMEFKYPRQETVEECVEQNFQLLNRATPELEYYDEADIVDGKHSIKKTLKLICGLGYNFVRRYI